MLDPIKTSLTDIQKKLLALLTPNSILIGHSLNADLTAIKLTHPFIIDTAIIYPHARGAPLKNSLKFITQKHLQQEIQQGDGSRGHDSVEDARACMELTRLKCKKGLRYASAEPHGENMFLRLSRSKRPGSSNSDTRTGAVVEWRGSGLAHSQQAEVTLQASNSAEFVEMIAKATTNANKDPEFPGGGTDLVWGRYRQLEIERDWWNPTKDPRKRASNPASKADASDTKSKQLRDALAETVETIKAVYDSLPDCTAFVVYSGTGNPLPMWKLQAMHKQFRSEYRTRKWDDLTVQWTDTEEQAMKEAIAQARDGVGFVTIK
jgi:RNA exonuclease 1